jgi:hypothetical protein
LLKHLGRNRSDRKRNYTFQTHAFDTGLISLAASLDREVCSGYIFHLYAPAVSSAEYEIIWLNVDCRRTTPIARGFITIDRLRLILLGRVLRVEYPVTSRPAPFTSSMLLQTCIWPKAQRYFRHWVSKLVLLQNIQSRYCLTPTSRPVSDLLTSLSLQQLSEGAVGIYSALDMLGRQGIYNAAGRSHYSLTCRSGCLLARYVSQAGVRLQRSGFW